MVDPSLQDRYLKKSGTIFLTGVQAIVRFLLDKQRRDIGEGKRVRRTFVTGYEGSPLGGLDLEIRRNMDLLIARGNFVHQAAVNEKTAAAAVHGSQFIGDVDGFWYGKAHGTKWALDEFSLANIAGTGTESGVVVFAGDDHMAKSSGYPAGSENALRDARAAIFYPSSVAEILTYAHHALSLSRYSGLICGLKLVTPICDGAETIVINPDHPSVTLPDYRVDGKPFKKTFQPVVIATSSIPYEEELTTIRLDIAKAYAQLNNIINDISNPDASGPLGLIATGKSYPDVMQALQHMGLKDRIPVLKLGMIYPVDDKMVRRFARDLTTIVVIEEKGPFVEEAVAHALVGSRLCDVYGKRGPRDEFFIPAHGELNPDLLVQILGPFLGSLYPDASVQDRLDQITTIYHRETATHARRAAHYCPGCPHSISAQAPSGEVAGGEIGCSSIDAYIHADGRGVKYIPTMGLGGALNNGMFPFNDNQHLFQNIGDGTVLHSGLITILSSISHGANVTYKILWNHVVAMTGGQDITGQPTLDDFIVILFGLGIKEISVVSKYPDQVHLEKARTVTGPDHHLLIESRDQLAIVQKQLSEKQGVKVLLFDQECATENRRRRKRQHLAPEQYIYINEAVCEGCGDCGQQSMCLALSPVETEYGQKTSILQSACNQDISCLKGDCPSFVSVEPKTGVLPAKPKISSLEASDLYEPENKVQIQGTYAIHIIGIGGTGVVTIAHLIGFAALFEGKKVNELNRTGLAQKGGPVESPVIIGDSEMPPTSFIAAGQCDLYMAADIVGAVNPLNLQVADPDHTVAIVSRSNIPTSEMMYNPQIPFADVDAMAHHINQYTLSGANVFIDTQAYAIKLFGDHIFANIFHLGVAYQAGRIPLKADYLEQAIRLNGQAVDINIQAFRWGRMAIMNRSRLDGMLSPPPKDVDTHIQDCMRGLSPGDAASFRELIGKIPLEQEIFRRLWTGRIADLIAYQNVAYARRYVNQMVRVFEADRNNGGEEHHYLLTNGAAEMFYKLMAYKDEYEVARLLTGPSEKKIRDAFDGPVKLSYHLHPPVLRERGLNRKLSFGPWFRPVLLLMAKCKGLRGKLFDPFGRSAARREERVLIGWYETLIEQTLSILSPATYPDFVELLRVPDAIRGYEKIKQRSIDRTRRQAEEILINIKGKTEQKQVSTED